MNQLPAIVEDQGMIIGGLLARMDRVEEDVKQIGMKQDEILRILHTAQGGWRTLVTVGTIGAGIGGVFVALITNWSTIKGFLK